jgi:Bacterial Ig domain
VTGTAGSITARENKARAGTLASNDPDSDATFAVGTGPSHGTLSGFSSTTGAFTYTPNAGTTGADSFTFTVTDEGVTTARR